MDPGPRTLGRPAARVYTGGMEKTTQTLMARSLVGSVLAALLVLTPPAGAAKTSKTRKATPLTDSEAQRLLAEGLADIDRGRPADAIQALTRAVRLKPSVSAYFLLGWAHYQRGFRSGSAATADRDDAQSAIDAYALALKMDPKLSELPDRSRLDFSMGLCYEAVESYDQALTAYKRALASAPNKALIPLHAARLRLKMKDSDKAVANVEMAVKKAAQNGKEKSLREQVLRDPAFALLLADAGSRRALGLGAPEDGLQVAAVDIRGEQLRDAVRDVPRPAAPAPDPAVLEKVSQGNIELKFRRYAAAVAAYQEALSLDTARPTLGAGQLSRVYEKIGSAHNRTGQSEEAIQFLRKSLQSDPMNASAHYQLALAYAVSGKSGTALNALREAFRSASGTPELRRLILLAKTDVELEGVRDLRGFRAVITETSDRVALR